MLDYMRALHQRFCQEPECRNLQEQAEELRQELKEHLDRNGREKLLKLVKGPVGLVTLTEVTCVASNITMPEQYISIVVPGRMYAEEYRKMGLHPKTLSNALESAGTVSGALIPWNTCGAYMSETLGVAVGAYAPFAVFNYLMPIVTIVMAFMGITIAGADGGRYRKKKKAAAAQ